MTLRLADMVELLADKVQAELVGDPELLIERLSTLEAAGPNDLAFLSHPKYLSQLAQSAAGCVIVAPSAREAAAQAWFVHRGGRSLLLLCAGHAALEAATFSRRGASHPSQRFH